ncbi:MAG: hypothetical protein J2P52_16590 [Blastocatellia bacterium]|nr:hypothetical protein [Blastocatellia bacterium]
MERLALVDRLAAERLAVVDRLAAERLAVVDRLAAERLAVVDRLAAERFADTALLLRLLLFAVAFLAGLDLPDPLFLPPPEIKLTVAQARRSASCSPIPRSL